MWHHCFHQDALNIDNNFVHFIPGQNIQVRQAMPQVVQFPAMQQTVPVQVPIGCSANGQPIYQTMHIPLQALAGQMPGLVQPQMQIFPQIAQVWISIHLLKDMIILFRRGDKSLLNLIDRMNHFQVANIITPSGQIQQVQLAPMNQLQGTQQIHIRKQAIS